LQAKGSKVQTRRAPGDASKQAQQVLGLVTTKNFALNQFGNQILDEILN
jgi:hypothetical protein